MYTHQFYLLVIPIPNLSVLQWVLCSTIQSLIITSPSSSSSNLADADLAAVVYSGHGQLHSHAHSSRSGEITS